MIKAYILTILSFFFLSILPSCDNYQESSPEFVKYQKIREGFVKGDSLNRYHILLPEKLDSGQQIPLLLVLDSHGDGLFAVNKFKDAVQSFPCIVMGSDLIRNNYPDYDRAITALINEAKRSYPVQQDAIVLSGFSGGARMAYNYSLGKKVNGVLMCAAGPGDQLPACPLYAISGMGDFNFREQYKLPSSSQLKDLNYTTDYFHGGHEWPGTDQLKDALLLLYKDVAIQSNVCLIRSRELTILADSLTENQDLILAFKALEKAVKIAPGDKAAKKPLHQASILLQSEEFKAKNQELQDYLNQEIRIMQTLSQSISTKDIDWWKKQIDALNQQISMHTPGLQKDHFLRMKAFMGILFYSAVNQLLGSPQGTEILDDILEAYNYAEPENPDPYFYRAVYEQRLGNRAKTITALKKAKELGFSDQGKLESEFTEDIIADLFK